VVDGLGGPFDSGGVIVPVHRDQPLGQLAEQLNLVFVLVDLRVE
jgi:hypothetical protein